MQTEHNWLEHDSREAINKDEFDKEEQISRAVYHAYIKLKPCTCTSIIQLMALFYEYTAPGAMVKHGITVQTQAIQFQTLVRFPL